MYCVANKLPCLRRQMYQPISAAAPASEEPRAISSGTVGRSIFPLFCAVIALLLYAVVIVVAVGTTRVAPGGRPALFGVLVAVICDGVGVGCVVPPGGTPAALVLIGAATVVVGVVPGFMGG